VDQQMSHHRCAFVVILLTSATILVSTVGGSPSTQTGGYRFEELTGGSRELHRHFTEGEVALLEKLNRRDVGNLAKLSRVVRPTAWDLDDLAYSPLPRHYAPAAPYQELIVVHQPVQVFGGYEYGHLVRWGPVSSGKRESPTPDGLFYLTWRSEGRNSTIDPDWFMRWYYNFDNMRGLSFHEYILPGRPASHGCVRLLARDAKWLYEWGEPWQVEDDGKAVVTSGTPVLIVGRYDFDAPPPWQSLDSLHRTVELPPHPLESGSAPQRSTTSRSSGASFGAARDGATPGVSPLSRAGQCRGRAAPEGPLS